MTESAGGVTGRLGARRPAAAPTAPCPVPGPAYEDRVRSSEQPAAESVLPSLDRDGNMIVKSIYIFGHVISLVAQKSGR